MKSNYSNIISIQTMVPREFMATWRYQRDLCTDEIISPVSMTILDDMYLSMGATDQDE